MELESNAKTPMLTGSAAQQQSSRGGVQTTVRLTPPNDQSMPRAVSLSFLSFFCVCVSRVASSLCPHAYSIVHSWVS